MCFWIGDENVHTPAPALQLLIKTICVSERSVMNSGMLCLNLQHSVLKGDNVCGKWETIVIEVALRVVSLLKQQAYSNMCVLAENSLACSTEVLRRNRWPSLLYLTLHSLCPSLCISRSSQGKI